TLALATIPMQRLTNATAAYNVVRNFGGSIGVALATTLVVRRSQYHQATLGAHVTAWSPDTTDRLRSWTEHFRAGGADTFTAERRALAMVYRDTVAQAQVLSYADAYIVLVGLFIAIICLLPWLRRVRADSGPTASRPAPRAAPVAKPTD